jgi:hypothetical protein
MVWGRSISVKYLQISVVILNRNLEDYFSEKSAVGAGKAVVYTAECAL